jgi:hypothetical protein
MGWERKRGKLLDLNKFLLNEFDSFPIKAGPLEVLERVRYVITLDSDTQLPRGTAARMIGTMAHPLNQAIIDPKLRIVTKGYGILQPRVGVSVASASRSRLASPLLRRDRLRHLHSRRLRRLPRPLRRGHLCRQGHLRGQRSAPGPRPPLSHATPSSLTT